MKTTLPILLSVLASLLLAGCATVKPEDFRSVTPEFRIEEYFAKPVRAWGFFQSRSGEVKKRFVVDITAVPQADGILLQERFLNDDGTRESRDWLIRKIDAHHYEGTAADVDGIATGVAYGNALNWRYTLNLPVSGKVWKVQFDDWMFLQPDGVLINRAKMKKFGITLGEVLITFQQEQTP